MLSLLRSLFLVCALAVSGSEVARAAAPAPLPEFTPWSLAKLGQAPAFEWVDQASPVRSLLYAGEPYAGKPTRVFAYYATPVTLGLEPASARNYPALVLVHGGGGKAFDEWVQVYARRGYAAIAMDLSGNRPAAAGKTERLPDGGPNADDATKFKADVADEDAWTYHAVADVLLAHSLVRSFPEVDADRTGVTGISWGGYLTCIVAGVDSRFKAACPQYGCGFLGENSYWAAQSLQAMPADAREHWLRLWDPSSYVGSAVMPMLFADGSNDFAYPLDSYQKTYGLVQAPKNIRIQPAMPHGHIFDVKEIGIFFDAAFQGGTPLPHVTSATVQEAEVVATVEGATAVKAATLQFTKGPHRQNLTRPWTSQPLRIEGKVARGAAPPADATAWYITVTDDREAQVSSEVYLP